MSSAKILDILLLPRILVRILLYSEINWLNSCSSDTRYGVRRHCKYRVHVNRCAMYKILGDLRGFEHLDCSPLVIRFDGFKSKIIDGIFKTRTCLRADQYGDIGESFKEISECAPSGDNCCPRRWSGWYAYTEMYSCYPNVYIDVGAQSYQPQLGAVHGSWVPWKLWKPISMDTECLHVPILLQLHSQSIEFHREHQT